MKIAIASVGKSEDEEISQVSGRAPYYLIFKDGKLEKTIKNPFRIGGGGAGLAVAEMLSDEEIELVIAGAFGDKMKGVLKEKGISFKELSKMKVKEALES